MKYCKQNKKINLLRVIRLFLNKLGSERKCKTKIIPYLITWDGMVTNYHKQYSREIGLII
ncbi:hypothetical protein PAEPH01_1936, partial [Pancytospora epiphaga]